MAGLTPLQLQLVVLTFGLADGVAHDEPEVAQRLEITAWRAKSNLGSALSDMWRRDLQIESDEKKGLREAVERAVMEHLLPETPIEDLSLNVRSHGIFRHAGIYVVADLIGLSAEDLRVRLYFDEEMLKEVETTLAAHSLKLKD